MFEARKLPHFFHKGSKDCSNLRNGAVFWIWNSTAECLRSIYLVCDKAIPVKYIGIGHFEHS